MKKNYVFCSKNLVILLLILNIFSSINVAASDEVTNEFDKLPKKNLIVNNETFDEFTTNKDYISYTTLSATDYQIPIKISKNGQYNNISVKSITGASGNDEDRGVQAYNASNSNLNGIYVAFFLNGRVDSTSAITSDRIVFETDIMISQTDAEVQLRESLGSNENYTLFYGDGTVGSSGKSTYQPDVWKHLIIDLDFPGKTVKFYYDDVIVDVLKMTDSQAKAGTGKIQFNLINNNTDSAAFAFDNVNVYIVAPYSKEIIYCVDDSVSYNAISNTIIPTYATKIILPLSGSFKSAQNALDNISFVCENKAVDDVKITYTETTDSATKIKFGQIEIELPQKISFGDYSIRYNPGLLMTQKVGTSTTSDITLEVPYEQSIKLIETYTIEGESDSNGIYVANAYYDSDSNGTATLIIASYKNINGEAMLTALNHKQYEIEKGLNVLSLSHSDSSSDFAKIMLWSDTSGSITPLIKSEIISK